MVKIWGQWFTKNEEEFSYWNDVFKRIIYLSNLDFDSFGCNTMLERIGLRFRIVKCFWNIWESKTFQNETLKNYNVSKNILASVSFAQFMLQNKLFWNCLHLVHIFINECQQIHAFQSLWKWYQCITIFRTEPNQQFKI